MPSATMVKVMTLAACAMSPCWDGKRALSWFSLKEPRREMSLHETLFLSIDSESLAMLPLVLLKALISGK